MNVIESNQFPDLDTHSMAKLRQIMGAGSNYQYILSLVEGAITLGAEVTVNRFPTHPGMLALEGRTKDNQYSVLVDLRTQDFRGLGEFLVRCLPK